MATQAELNHERRLATIETEVKKANDWLEDISHDIRGNGKPGLVDRVTRIEERQEQCPARLNATGASMRERVMVGLTACGLIVAFGGVRGVESGVVQIWPQLSVSSHRLHQRRPLGRTPACGCSVIRSLGCPSLCRSCGPVDL